MDRSGESRTAGLGLWPAIALVIGHTSAIGIFLTPAELIGAVASPGSDDRPVGGLRRAGAGRRVHVWRAGLQISAGRRPLRVPAGRLGRTDRVPLRLAVAADHGPWRDRGARVRHVGVRGRAVAGGERRRPAAADRHHLGAGPPEHGRPDAQHARARRDDRRQVPGVGGGGRSRRSRRRRAAGRISTRSSHGSRSTVPLAEAMALALVSVFFSFGGFWEASRIADEVRDAAPQHAARRWSAASPASPRSMWPRPAGSSTPCRCSRSPARRRSRGWRARRCSVRLVRPSSPASWCCRSLTSLLALMIMAPRLYVAMGRDGLFPAALASVSRATRSPVRATLLLATLASGFAFVGDVSTNPGVLHVHHPGLRRAGRRLGAGGAAARRRRRRPSRLPATR